MAQNEDLGQFTLRQQDGVFPLGADTLDLANFVTLRPGGRVCDLGTGSGALPLLLLQRQPQLTLTAVELDSTACALAEENFAHNHVPVRLVPGDYRHPGLLEAGAFDVVVANPPYFPVESGKQATNTPHARGELTCTLEELCQVAARLTRNRGRFALVHRPERLSQAMGLLARVGLEPKRLQLIQHSPTASPCGFLLEAVRQGKPGLEILPTHVRTLHHPSHRRSTP